LGSPYTERRFRTACYLELLTDPEEYRTNTVGLWRRYWEVHFRDERMTCVQIWEQSIREKSLALSRQDAREYVKKLPGKSELPDQIPQGYAAHDILVAGGH